MLMIFGSLGFMALSPLLNLLDFFNSYILLIICYVLASNIHSVCAQYICAIGRTKLFAGQGILNTALTVILNIIFLAGFDMGVLGYVLAIVLSDFLTTLFVFFSAGLYKAFVLSKISGKIIKELLRFCLPLVPSTVFWWITGVSDRYLVAAMASAEENGLYAAAYKIPTLLTYVVTIFNDAWKLSAVSESEDKEKCADFYSQIYRYYIAIMFVGGGAIALFSQLFSRILFAESYYSAWIFIPVLSAATVFTALDTFLGSVYFTVKRTSMSLWTSLIGAVVNIALNRLWIPQWGAMGASVATFISYFLVYVIRAATMGRFMKFKMYHGKLMFNTVLVLAISAVMTLYGDDWWGIVATAGILVVSAVFNLRDILVSVKQILSSVRGRKTE
jgi:O-antigen/teichoic acid export membrane protein